MGIQFSGLASGLDTTSIVSDLMQVENMRVENKEKEKTLVEWKKDAWADVNTKLYSFYKEELFDFKSSGSYSQKTLTSSAESIVTATRADADVSGSFSLDVSSVASSAFLTGDALDGTTSATTAATLFGMADTDVKTISISVDGGSAYVDVSIEATDTMASIAEKFEALDIGLKVDFDNTFERFFFSTEATGDDASIMMSGDEADLTALGFSDTDNRSAIGSDAVFKYNGTELRSASNEVSVNGLSFTVNGVGASTINVTQDVDAIYEQVKTFVNKYNELMGEMTTFVDAEAVYDYEPLTDDEKEAMTDDEIEDWEDLIKASLLRNDDNMSSIVYTLRNTLTTSSGVSTGDFTYRNLSQLGIVTGSYEEKGLLHIEGDEDDSTYSNKTNKLRDAIENDPEAVKELLTALGSQLYSTFADKMKSSSLSSALTFYNDKYMDDQIEDYEDDIYDLEDLMETIEDRYYSQFTAMEQSIQASNSTGEWLAQQLAGM